MTVETAITILNTDDDEAGRYAKSRLLRQTGYTILEATTGAETLQLAQQQPNLIVLDIHLPDINGIEICSRLKADPATAVIPILLISATYVDSHWYAAGLESGADGYLTEPVEPIVFLATVRALLRAQQVEAALRQARDELELRVAERTTALAEANRALQAEILERKRAEEEAGRRAAHASALARVAASFNAHLELSQVLKMVREESARLLNTPTAVILYDQSNQAEFITATQGLPSDFHQQLYPALQAIQAQYAQRSSPLWVIPDAQQLPNLSNASFFAQANIRTMAGVQLDHGVKAIGMLLAFVTGETRAFSEQELDLMQGVARQASMALANALLFQQVQAGHARLLRLGQRLVTAQEEERQRLAHELHDAAGQTLTALKFSLSLLRNDLLMENQQLEDASPEERLDDAIQLVDEVMTQIRLLSHGLLPFSVEMISLDEALRGLCHDFAARTQLPIAYSGCEPPPLSAVVQLSFYRFLQEALTNVARHAEASQVQVTLNLDDNYLSLIVADDGRGFDPQTAIMSSNRFQGIGLLGMRERFAFLGGEVELESEPGRGTRITTRYPLPGIS